ncbi:hypothetical protein KIW84_021191 [Lathyrus oleraceus]|uniref:Retrotransposon gag domain-containing protein n=1 Tax=Pisum sativum TaxID=3888 RepID=A0A9D5B9M2_PEA|nr:hypothetical protein KIW84_021191 [Pisum sativum]
MGDYGGANALNGRLTILNQPVNVANFQLHPNTINQLERKHFTGKVNEDANKHLQRFLTMSNTLKIDGHTEEAKKLRMFPFTLAEEAEEWFYSLPVGSITFWEEMEKSFLNEYFPASMQMFVNGLKIKTKQLIDTAVGGSTNFSTATGIKKIIEVIAANEHMELYDRCQSKLVGVIDLKLETNKIRIEDTIAAEVDKKLKQLASSSQAQGALPSATVTNPREHNNVSTVTTRSGKVDEVVEEVDEEEDQLIKVDLEIKENEVVREEVVTRKLVVKETVIEPKSVVKLPFPTRNKKK